MKRKDFIRSLAWITGGFIGSQALPASARSLYSSKLKGKVTSSGKGLKGVIVSDGYTVVATDDKGEFKLDPHPDATTIFVSTPSGFAFNHENHIARHYRFINSLGKKDLVFDLVPLDQDDQKHQFIIWADPQVKNMKDVEKMNRTAVPDVRKWRASLPSNALVHGICVGDIVWDAQELFPEYDKAVAKMEVPFFQCLGNHDMDYGKGGDDTSDDTFIQTYGPSYYSFNRGAAHYIVMDNVRYLGKDRDYDGWLQQHQLDWLEKDLSFVPQDELIVLCMHIPVHSGTKNRDALYQLLGDRQVHIMTGHTHYHVNAVKDNVYEHNHGTVCGAWWTGPICTDGTPNGYGVYQVDGNKISWHYQSMEKPADHQMAIYSKPVDSQVQVTVNIWNHDPMWSQEYWVDGIHAGQLEQYTGLDPLAYSTMMGPDLPKTRSFAEPSETNHLFKATLPMSAKQIKVKARDRFGNEYFSSHELVKSI